jgi:hypothetical protein
MNKIGTVFSASLGWRCDIINDGGSKSFLKFYNSDSSGSVRGPWMSIPVRGVDGKWSVGSREDFAREVNKFLREISAALTANGIDHLG